MSKLSTHRGAAAAAVVLIAGAAFAGGSLTSADAGSAPLSTKQVKKIADKEIKKKAKTLSVAHAGSADFATSAGQAAKVGSSTVRTFAFQVANGGPATTAVTVGAFSLVATCPGGSPTMDATSTAGGQMRYMYINGAGTTGHGGSSALGDVVVNDPASTGTGSLDYTTSATAGGATDVSYSWRSDNGSCQFLGSYVTG